MKITMHNKNYKIKDLESFAYRYILFDWDGTLAKTLDVWFYAEKDHLKQYGIEIPDIDLVKSFGDWGFGKKLGVKDNDKFIKELVEDVGLRLKGVELYENVVNLLEAILFKTWYHGWSDSGTRVGKLNLYPAW